MYPIQTFKSIKEIKMLLFCWSVKYKFVVIFIFRKNASREFCSLHINAVFRLIPFFFYYKSKSGDDKISFILLSIVFFPVGIFNSKNDRNILCLIISKQFASTDADIFLIEENIFYIVRFMTTKYKSKTLK